MELDAYGYDDQMPPGYRFCPSKEELLLYYLRPKVNGEKVAGEGHVVFDFDLYGDQEPWKIWDNFKTKRANDLKKNNDLYFFTELKKKTSNEDGGKKIAARKQRICRTVGKGTWKGEDRGKKILAPGTNYVIGSRKRFRYENKQSAQNGRWIMHEFDLDQSLGHNQQGRKYVLCVLRKNEESEKKRKQREEEIVGENVLHDQVDDYSGCLDSKQAVSAETQERRQRLLPCIDNVPPLQPLEVEVQQCLQMQCIDDNVLTPVRILQAEPVSLHGVENWEPQGLLPCIDNGPVPLEAELQRHGSSEQKFFLPCLDTVPSFAGEELSSSRWEKTCWEQFSLPDIDDVPTTVADHLGPLQEEENAVNIIASNSTLPIDWKGSTTTQVYPERNLYARVGDVVLHGVENWGLQQGLLPCTDKGPVPLEAELKRHENLEQKPSFAGKELSTSRWEENWEQFTLSDVVDVPTKVADQISPLQEEENGVNTNSTLPIDWKGSTTTQVYPESNVYGGVGELTDGFNYTPWIKSFAKDLLYGINTRSRTR